MPAKKKQRPNQTQTEQPGREYKMRPRPVADDPEHRGSGKLRDRIALVTGGDSGIGRAVTIAFAKEGAHVAIVYLNEHRDAKETQALVEEEGVRCVLIAGDVGDKKFCRSAIKQTAKELGGLDILVNKAAEQHPQKSIEEITEKQLVKTFRTNIFSMFFLTKAAMKHLRAGSAIINTASVTAYKGSPELLDYSATKGAIIAFTRSLSQALATQKIASTRWCPDRSGRRSFHRPFQEPK